MVVAEIISREDTIPLTWDEMRIVIIEYIRRRKSAVIKIADLAPIIPRIFFTMQVNKMMNYFTIAKYWLLDNKE